MLSAEDESLPLRVREVIARIRDANDVSAEATNILGTVGSGDNSTSEKF